MTGVHLSSLTDSERKQLMPNQTIQPRSEKRLLMPNPTKERLFSQTSRHSCIQCCGSMKFWGSCYFCQGPSRCQQKIIFFCLLLFEGTLHHFSKIKIHKEVTKVQSTRNQCFSYYFCLMIEGSGSLSLSNVSVCGSGKPKNT